MNVRKIGFLAFGLFFIALSAKAQEDVQSPSGFLGYELGTHWTPHYKVLNYFRHVAEISPMVELQQYGTSNEGKELVIAKISSVENMSRLTEIRTNNLRRTGLVDGEPSGDRIAVVWLSYNVHGNETSSSEAALKTIYELVRPGNSETKQWLQNTVVIIDPMINPDGRDRYVHWYTETAAGRQNINRDAREHREPWPGGRTNHYYFDLNRDWAWLTQKESRHRTEIYQQWMPHIHVDFHEQGINSPYYFAPAAVPFHNAITEWQRNFQFTIGKNHARYFDENGWLYFTREVFDLFYPSYGDTYPIFNGAIGMTYEQAGGGSAGLGVLKEEGDTLSLKDRLMHHYTTGLSTVEITSKNADRVIEEFAAYYQTSRNNPEGEYKTYVIKSDTTDALTDMLGLLEQHKVQYGQATESGTYSAYNYRSGQAERVEVKERDLVISAYQPKSVLARIFFEPQPELEDSLTYDITAWSLPYAYGLEGYALSDHISWEPVQIDNPNIVNELGGKAYAYLAEWKNLGDVKMLAGLLKKDIVVRYATEPFSIEGRNYSRGTLIITRAGNKNMGDRFDRVVQSVASNYNQEIYAVSTGFVSSGSDFGSSSVQFLERPNIALLSGEGTSSNRVGEIWHFFDRQINYPVTLIDTDYFNRVELDAYDVLILPSGYYGNILGDEQLGEIREWISNGGRLLAVQGANGYLAGKDGFSLSEKESGGDGEEEDETGDPGELDSYSERQRQRVPGSNAGSIYRITMDETHPLAFGYENEYFSLKLDTDSYSFLERGWNVGVVREDALMSGFVGHEARQELENTLTFGVQNMGNGAVIYMIDNPLFRGFWYNGKLLFSNAVFLVGQ